MDLNFLSLTPYPTYQEENDSEFFFTTDEGDDYTIYFTDTEGYFPKLSYSNSVKLFGFDYLGKPKSVKYDRKISDTIITSILNFLSKETNILIYVCGQSDAKQRYRNRLFNRWFKDYNQMGFVKYDITYDGDTYVSFLTSSKNPNLFTFQYEFMNFGNEYK